MDIKEILKSEGFVFSKRYGQNFITDTNLLRAVAADAGADKDGVCVEVGAGAGTLTRELCKSFGKVVSFEIDERLRPVLEKTLGEFPDCRIVFSDILKTSREELMRFTGGKYRVAANLPYYITTPIIFYFLGDVNCESITVMVQKEVADRLVSPAGMPEYGAVSAQIALMGSVKITRTVPRNMFFPVPNVDSAVVRIDIRPKVEDAEKRESVSKVIAASFAMRRKTLVNNLSSGLGVSREHAVCAVRAAGFRDDVRGEKLGIEEFIRLTECL